MERTCLSIRHISHLFFTFLGGNIQRFKM